MTKNLATQMAPPFVLVAHYFIAGAVFYAISSFLLPFYADDIGGYFLSNQIAGLVHLYLLGFVMMVIFGAMYQLIPVVLEIPLFSKDFAYVQFYIYLVGIVIFCLSLWYESLIQLLPYGALMVYISMLIFIVNLFLTYKNLEHWTLVAKFIFVSNLFLLFGAGMGFFISLDLIYGFFGDILKSLSVHIAATIGGYVMMSIMGVGMVLLPMFSLAHNFSQKPMEWAFYAMTLGLLGYIIASFLQWQTVLYLSFALILVAIILGIYQMYSIFKARVRRQNDFWAKNMIASFLSLIVCLDFIVFAILGDEQRYLMAFGFLLFFGFFIFFIVGHIYKILPFLVWYQRFSPLVGKCKVPMLHQMIKERVADVQFWVSVVGIFMCGFAILLDLPKLFCIGAYVMGVGTLLVLFNIVYTLSYKPKEENVK
jgi:hypothetical protein